MNGKNIYKKLNDFTNNKKIETVDEEVEACIKLIDDININETNTNPNYMDDIKKQMDNAKSVFSKLNQVQQRKVERTNKRSWDWLSKLESALNKLGNFQEAIEKFNEICKLITDKTHWTHLLSDDIDAISIDNSSYYYSLLTDNQKRFISTKSEYKKLISMIKEFDESEKQIDEVRESIDKIPCWFNTDVPHMASNSKYADDVKTINDANSAYSNLNDYQKNKVINKERLFNALKELDKQNKIINDLMKKINNKTFLSDEDKTDINDILPRYVSSREEVSNIHQLFNAVYELFIDLVDKIQINGQINNENKKQIKYALELYNLMPKEFKEKGKNKYENLENMKKIAKVDNSIQIILDSQLEKIDAAIKKAKDNYDNLTTDQKNKVSNYDELLKYEQKANERNKREKKIEKYKDDLNKIKAPLKDLSNFEHNNSKDFSEKFNEQLLKGLDLCLKYDEQLKEYCDNQIINNLKSASDEDKIDVLNNILCKEKWITFVSRDYLLFMINLIECKQFYLEDSKNNVIDYKDPKWNDLALNELEKKLEKEKGINNEVKTLINKLFSEKDDGSKTVKNLKSVYAYVNDDKNIDPTDKKTLKWISEDWFIAKKHHKVLDKIIRELENKQKEFDENKKLSIEALQILNRIELKEDSKLTECNIPVWNIKDNKPSLSTKDLKQGEIGDCWLISALISIVKNNPEDILKCFPNRDKEIDNTGNLKGDYITVRLYKVMLTAHRKKDGRLRAYARPIRPITIKMKSTIYERGNKINFAWPKFIEKAASVYRAKKMLKLAKIDDISKFEKEWLNSLKNDWLENNEIAGSHNLESSTNDGIVMTMLLGNTSGGSNKDVFDDSLGTIEFTNYLRTNLNKFKKKNVTVSFTKQFETNGEKISNGHAYSITNVDEKNVYLTNPYDETKELEIPMDIFCEYCMGVTFGHSSQS